MMLNAIRKIPRPLLVLMLLVMLRKLTNESGRTILGSRTMEVLKRFKDRLGGVAKAVQKESGISADLGLGQAAHESANGDSALASPNASLDILNSKGLIRKGPAHNYFGFTAELGTYWRSQDRPFVMMETSEWVEKPLPTDKVLTGPNSNGLYHVRRVRPFRAYASPEESYRDWARLMQTPNYVNAGVLDALKRNDSQGFGAALLRAKYATDPKYATGVVSRIEALRGIA